jgi:hypothetical protein
MASKIKISWLKAPEAHDYPAADSYLNLVFAPDEASRLIKKLRRAPMTEFKAKDIFRASGLTLLGISNLHMERNRKKIMSGKPLSPLLLVRGGRGRLIIADGYHRLCSVYAFDEDAIIPTKIV